MVANLLGNTQVGRHIEAVAVLGKGIGIVRLQYQTLEGVAFFLQIAYEDNRMF